MQNKRKLTRSEIESCGAAMPETMAFHDQLIGSKLIRVTGRRGQSQPPAVLRFGGAQLFVHSLMMRAIPVIPSGFGSYQKAWGWLHKMRGSMIRPGREKICGRVEVDEIYIGGRKKKGARGRGAEAKTLVLVAVEGEESKLGQVRFRCIPTADAKNLESFVTDYVDPKAKVVTDGLSAYNGLSSLGFNHQPYCIATDEESALKQLDHVHLVASLLKRWLMGTAPRCGSARASPSIFG